MKGFYTLNAEYSDLQSFPDGLKGVVAICYWFCKYCPLCYLQMQKWEAAGACESELITFHPKYIG